MGVIVESVLLGMLVMLAGTLPRNFLYAANLRVGTSVPWAVPVIAVILWAFWRFFRGDWSAEAAAAERRSRLRAHSLPGRLWVWALLAGTLGLVALVLTLRVANRLVALPPQQAADFTGIPAVTVVSLLVMAAPVAGIVEEAAFRGYMQGPIERRYGPLVAILITGTMFAVAHLDFTLVLWPYYVAVAAIYGSVTYLTNSILPAVVLHTAGNLYSNFDLWLHGQAEWQTASGPGALIWSTGPDRAFWMALLALLLVTGAMVAAYVGLVKARSPSICPGDAGQSD